ncbi:protein FAM184A-like [Tubulanus polymorphus]|uniref:protein FAM184A-like n=1 Tax=Tubulanus polymorphus TaxID=672921 RepID=UPI003DA1FD6C
MAASTKQPFNYYTTGKYGTLPQKDTEVSQDMHLKMSKKIAQLTKVIYALNTKNDEHEAIIQNIKEQNEEQIQKILAETKTKLEQYRSKIGNDVEQKRKIQSLRDAVEEYERQKNLALGDFERFKKNVETREHDIKTEHTQKIISLSKEIATIKRDYEEQLTRFESLRIQFNADKQSIIEDMKNAHKLKIDELLKTQQGQQTDLESERLKIEREYNERLQKLQDDFDKLTAEKSRLIEDYDGKLNKAQAFYEKELQALRDSQSKAGDEQIRVLRGENDKLRKDYAFLENENKKRIDDLLQQIVTAEDEVEKYKRELEKVKKEFEEKDSNSRNISRQLYEVKNELVETLGRLQLTETDLSSSRLRVEEQAEELLKRSTNIGELEATRLQHEATIKDLRMEVDRLRGKLSHLEKEKGSIESQSQSHQHETNNKIRTLERLLEDLQVEKKTMQEKFEREIVNLEQKSKQKESQLIESHATAFSKLRTQNQSEYDELKKNKDEEIAKIKRELEAMLNNNSEKFREDYESQQAELIRIKNEFNNQLQKANDEISRLEKLISEREQGLGSASSEIETLKNTSEKLKKELESTKNDLKSITDESVITKDELQKLRRLHEEKLREAAEMLEKRVKDISTGKDEDWANRIREECGRIKQQVTTEKETERRLALEQLTKQKDEEMNAARDGWQSKINELLEQISRLKSNIRTKEDQSSSMMDKLRKEAEDENRRLRNEMLEAADEYAKNITRMKQMHEEEIKKVTDQKMQDLIDLEENLKRKHIEDMQCQMTAHKSTVDSLKKQAEQQLKLELEDLTEKTKKDIERLQIELRHKHSIEIEQYSRAHQNQMSAARLELDRALEIAKQKETQYSLQVDELQDDIRHREKHISTLETELNKLQLDIDELAKELDHKGKEILKVRSDANQQIRTREEQMKNQHTQEVEKLIDEHTSQSEAMLVEFNSAQELLKVKIEEYKFLLEEAEERFRNRESRPEDLELIEQLRAALQDKEMAMKKLLDDKKYYQMELVNRETNFNKVFSTAPNVGVMNPLVKPKKYKKNQSATSLTNGKLDPLPGSPFHEEKLNPARPLPPHKKFLK